MGSSIIGCELVGIAATPFTTAGIYTWYNRIIKPSFQPPNWVFGPVWTILYALMGIAAYLVWEKGWEKREVKAALGIFGIQLILNFFWSLIFFGNKAFGWAFVEILFLWVFIALTIWKFYKISKTAAYLLIPYILWVSFASVLNGAIWWLNK